MPCAADLTIRSSRDRFAAAELFGKLSQRRGRKALRLNSGVRPVQKQMPVNKLQAKLALFYPRLSQAMPLATNSVPARAAGTPFLGSAFRKERSSVLHLAPAMGSWSEATAGTGLTIRSSRARFAASALAGYDLTIANAAQRPGLAQALGLTCKH